MTTMTNTAPDPAGQRTGPADELEDWLTDIRVTLSDDPPDWLVSEDDTTDPDDEPAVGRHRAAD